MIIIVVVPDAGVAAAAAGVAVVVDGVEEGGGAREPRAPEDPEHVTAAPGRRTDSRGRHSHPRTLQPSAAHAQTPATMHRGRLPCTGIVARSVATHTEIKEI